MKTSVVETERAADGDAPDEARADVARADEGRPDGARADEARADEARPDEVRRKERGTPATATWPRVERRSGGDRRMQPTRWYDSLLGHRRRRRGRRHGESRNIYVDVYHARDLVLIAVVFALNLVDAGLTLHHLAHGAVEQNPLMDRLIQWGPVWFLLEKVLVVGLCMGALLVHKTFVAGRRAAYLLLVVYGLLMVQHISML